MIIFGMIVIVAWVVFLLWRVRQTAIKYNKEIDEIIREDYK